MRLAKIININGIVQGVGFRPFVYQLAKQHRIGGEISNTVSGVVIYAEGLPKDMDFFCREIVGKIPPLARITDITSAPETVRNVSSFHIAGSIRRGFTSTLISPDAAVCGDCVREMTDPFDRRYLYPFINCTNCGPRYTIISDIPYDRKNTSMKHFSMCAECQAEYDDPDNRRFHAQPNACAACGPVVRLRDCQKKDLRTDDPIRLAAALLKDGYIVAVKGLGGFHLAADALNHSAVVQLRKRKHREEKPFALMSETIDSIRQFAYVDPEEESLLTSVQRPIVLLKKKEPNSLSEAVSPANRYFGAMLPYTPIHYLLFRFGPEALVMTSGNLSSEPIAADNDEAFERLTGVADFFLIHNRDIYIRSDDSIVRNAGGRTRMIRRSRGYIPTPVFLKQSLPQILACGAELKNTVCLTKDHKAFLSQHIGDMENLAAYDFFIRTIDHMKQILDIHPDIIACDLHPDYLSTRYAAEQNRMLLAPVQHHHAHIASCMAENQIDGPVIGLAFDGTGYGTDGKIWGGEVLIAETDQFTRTGHLAYIPMPGGASAVRSPWRMGVSFLYDAFGDAMFDLDIPFIKDSDPKKIAAAVQMIRKKINSPETSSMGRLFDGVAAMLGIRHDVYYEGQAAAELEMAAVHTDDFYVYDWLTEENTVLTAPMIRAIADDLKNGLPVSRISGKFHRTIVEIFSDVCIRLRKQTGVNRTVLSGGVFQNVMLLEGFMTQLEKNQFEVYTHRTVPTNDGGISLGQAVIAGNMTI